MIIAIILLSIVVIYLFFCIGKIMYNQRKFKEEVREEMQKQRLSMTQMQKFHKVWVENVN